MSLLSRDELRSIVQEAQCPCVSIYLPTHRAGAEIQQGPIRLKNLLRQAESGLAARNTPQNSIDRALEPIRALLDNTPFWQHQDYGLAIFADADSFHLYRLPLVVEELAVVGDRIHLTPLLPLLTRDGRFFVLALSQKETRLYEATRNEIRELDLGDTPASLAEAVGSDWEQKSLQYRSGTAPQGSGGRRRAIYHGHGSGEEADKNEIARFLQQVDIGVRKLLKDPQVPLVVAAVDYLFDMYRDLSKVPGLVAHGIMGNPDHSSPEELRAGAWQLVKPLFLASQSDSAEKYPVLASKGLATDDLQAGVLAAVDGRVETLFVALQTHRWGRLDTATREIDVDPERGENNEDLLDRAAVETFLHGGTVYAVDQDGVPGTGVLAALLRY
jgi:hypothetical protein